jgi:Heterokaryon incompatibility protein Het-C
LRRELILACSEATDHLSQTQISDVNVAVTHAGAQGGNSTFTSLQNLLGQLPGHTGRELSNECRSLHENSARMAQMQRSRGAGGPGGDYSSRATERDLEFQTGAFDPEVIAEQIYPILVFRDRVVKAINNTIDKVRFSLWSWRLIG